MSKILFFTNMERQYTMMEKARSEMGAHASDLRMVLLTDGVPWGKPWQDAFSRANLVLFTWMGSGLDTPFLEQASKYLRAQAITHAMLITEVGTEHLSCKVTEEEKKEIRRYLSFGGLKNYRALWCALLKRYGEVDLDVPAPDPLPWQGIYHPASEKAYLSLAEYKAEHYTSGKITVGLMFYRDEWVWGDLFYQKAVVEEIERQGMNAIAVFTTYSSNANLGAPRLSDAFHNFFYDGETVAIDAFINTNKFSLVTMKAIAQEELSKLNVPIFEAYTMYQTREEWKQSIEGLSAMEMALSIAMPEFDGALHGLPIAGREEIEEGQSAYLPIAERIHALVRRTKKWATLRRKPNKDKKIGIIFHNYPPKNSNIGSAAGLDSIESVRLLLTRMQAEGYRVDRIPSDGKVFIEELTTHATNDRADLTEKRIREADGKLSKKDYQKFYDALEERTKGELLRDWEEAPGDVFVYDDEVLVPGTMNGNVFVTVQPPRGFGEDPGKIYHSPDCAPTHHYLAYYHWIRDVWKADAVIHVGTHGSLEWLPGKSAALSRECYPDLSIDDVPNIYPYWITIVGEGVQAKRRGAACLISYLTPPMSSAGMYDEYEELEKLLDEYCHFKQNQPEKIETVQNLIREKAAEANLTEDLPEEPEKRFDDFVTKLHLYLTDIKNMQIRTGLHILGQAPQDEVLIEYLQAITAVDNDGAPSLMQTISSLYGYDYYDLLERSAEMTADGKKTLGRLADEVRTQGKEVLRALMEENFASAEVVLALLWTKNFSEEAKARLRKTAEEICKNIAPNLAATVDEMENLLRALHGEYIDPGPGGAPTSGRADVLPTGRNFYGVDPRTLPTSAAWEIGKGMAEDVIERYMKEEGRYPESIGIVLWATSNMRTYGECIAEFFYLMGVRPVWQKGSLRVIDVDVIPMAELKRPRIDVTGRISGLFRDSMPMAAQLIDRAMEKILALDESDEENYIKKHVGIDLTALVEEGVDPEVAARQARCRIFGDPPGAYGAGVSNVLDEKNWETIDDLGRVYLRWGSHAYSDDGKGEYLPEMFARRMGSLDVTIQNLDNREVSMLSSDDFNSYHGGMIATVRSLKGEAPRSYCGDSSDRNHVLMWSVEEEVKRLFRGEVMNPKFIEGMKAHGYKGAADLANYVAHSYQWDATSDVLDDWMYEKFANRYALDAKMQEWMRDVNPWALQRIAEVLLEAESRGLWNAKAETKKELEELFLSIEGDLEERGDESL